MHLALYGAGGFYTSGGGVAGRRGDFITSPEVGPLFGAVLARCARRDGGASSARPSSSRSSRRAPGRARSPGRSAPPGRRASMRCDYIAVEVSDAQRERHPEWVTSVVADARRRRSCGVVFANELLDNLPFRLFVMDGGVARGLRGGATATARSPRCCAAPTTSSTSRLPTDRRARVAGARAAAGRCVGAPSRGRRARRGRLRAGRLCGRHHRRPRPASVAAVAAHLSRARARRALPPLDLARRTSPPTLPSTSCSALSAIPTRCARSRSSCSVGASTSWSTRAGGSGPSRLRGRIVAAMAMRSRVREAEALLDVRPASERSPSSRSTCTLG